MPPMTAYNATLADAFWPRSLDNRWVRNITLAVVGSLLLTLSAKTHIPFWPVPMTMQTFAVLVLAMVYGPRLGTATVLLYLMEGAAGLPVFSGTPDKGIGIAYMAGPTGGYLVGFLAAAGLLGFLNTRGWDRSLLTTLAAMTLGTLVILGLGYSWLATLIGFEKAWVFGVQPFLWGAVFKIGLATAILPLLWQKLGKKIH